MYLLSKYRHITSFLLLISLVAWSQEDDLYVEIQFSDVQKPYICYKKADGSVIKHPSVKNGAHVHIKVLDVNTATHNISISSQDLVAIENKSDQESGNNKIASAMPFSFSFPQISNISNLIQSNDYFNVGSKGELPHQNMQTVIRRLVGLLEEYDNELLAINTKTGRITYILIKLAQLHCLLISLMKQMP